MSNKRYIVNISSNNKSIMVLTNDPDPLMDLLDTLKSDLGIDLVSHSKRVEYDKSVPLKPYWTADPLQEYHDWHCTSCDGYVSPLSMNEDTNCSECNQLLDWDVEDSYGQNMKVIYGSK